LDESHLVTPSEGWLRFVQRASTLIAVKLLVIVAVLVALVSATSATASSPTGFYESVRLEPAASMVAGKPVKVWCASSSTAYAAAAEGAGVRADAIAFASGVGGTDAYFVGRVCSNLTAYLNRHRVVMDDYAVSLLLIAHEATHLSGIGGESETDCAALHAMPAMLRRFFVARGAYTVHNVMAAAWAVHRRESADYTRLC
jgi:hypothetical protein